MFYLLSKLELEAAYSLAFIYLVAETLICKDYYFV